MILSVKENPGINRVLEYLCDSLLVHFIDPPRPILPHPHVPTLVEIDSYLIKRLTLKAQSESLLDQQEVVAVGSQELF
ncbi:MAG: hypothetical protein Q8L64_06165 [bacterium]|nr:hypothetical protein [bacterium]